MNDETQSQQPNAEFSADPPPLVPEQAHQVHQAVPHVSRTNGMATAIGIAGWLLPGLGHALQKMWGRAVACFLAVGFLVVIGAAMRGNLFQSQDTDAFGRLGYIANI